MFSNIFLKTLYTKRWSTLAWAVGLGALIVFTMSFFPTFKEVGQSFNDVPESLRSFLGDATAYSTIAGFADLQIISQYVFMTLIMGILLLTGLLAGEEGNGTLQSLLVHPVSRGKVYVQKLLAGAVLVGAVCAVISLSVLIGALLVHESIGLAHLAEAALAMWLVTMLFSSWGYALGAAMGRRAVAGVLAGALAFVTYLVTSLAESVKALRVVDKFSPFHYFNHPGILAHGLEWSDMAILGVITLLPLIVAYFIFTKRDIYQR